MLSSDAFWKFSPYEVYEESSWRIITIFASKNGGVCREVETHFESCPLAMFTKNFWVHFHDLYVRKRSCLRWSSDAFWKFFTCKFCRKGSGRIFMITASKNEAVCREVQTHFGSSPHSRFTETFLGAFSPFCVQKRSSLPWNSDGFWTFSSCKLHKKDMGARIFSIFASKNGAVCCYVETHFGSFRFASWVEFIWRKLRISKTRKKP